MLEIYSGRDKFYQWDVGQKLIVDNTIIAVHYDNGTGDALVCPVYEYEGQFVADVPNIMLQTVWAIKCYAYCGECVRAEKVYEVEKRSRPDDYIYTETETLRYSTLLDMLNDTNADITALEKNINSKIQQNKWKIEEVEGNLKIQVDAIYGVMNDNIVDTFDNTKAIEAVNKEIDTLEENIDIKEKAIYDTINLSLEEIAEVRTDTRVANNNITNLQKRMDNAEKDIDALQASGGTGTGGGIPAGEPGQYLITDDSGTAVWTDKKEICGTLTYSGKGEHIIEFDKTGAELFSLVELNEIQKYNIKLIELYKVYTLSLAVGSAEEKRLYFSRIIQEYAGQAMIETIVLEITKDGNITFEGLLQQNIPNIPDVPYDGKKYRLVAQYGKNMMWEEIVSNTGGEITIPLVMAYVGEGQIFQETIIPLEQLIELYGDSGIFTLKVVIVDAITMAMNIYSVYRIDSETMTLCLNCEYNKPIKITPDGVISFDDEAAETAEQRLAALEEALTMLLEGETV